LRVCEWLIGSAHDAETMWVSPRSMNAGMMVWKGRFAARAGVGMIRIEV